MVSVNVAGALNLLWAAGALFALGWLAASEHRRRTSLRHRCRRALAVFIAAVALFPSVSASDDLLRVSQMPLSLSAGAAVRAVAPERSDQRPAVYLARLSDALESSQISTLVWLLITVCFFAFIGALPEFGPGRVAPSPTGRAPPGFTSLS